MLCRRSNSSSDPKEENLGISVNVSTSIEGAERCCHYACIARHSVGYSLGFEGKTEKIPNSQVIMLSTMCGHGMISHSLAKKMIDFVKENRRSPEQAATYSRASALVVSLIRRAPRGFSKMPGRIRNSVAVWVVLCFATSLVAQSEVSQELYPDRWHRPRSDGSCSDDSREWTHRVGGAGGEIEAAPVGFGDRPAGQIHHARHHRSACPPRCDHRTSIKTKSSSPRKM